MAHGVSAAAPSNFDTYTANALEAHKLYVVEVRHPVEVAGAEREHLLQWLSKRLNFDLRAPNLDAVGLMLIGGRLLPGPTGGASAFFMYEASSGERFTLICTPSGLSETALRYRAEERYASYLLGRPRPRLRGQPALLTEAASTPSPRPPTSRSTKPRTRREGSDHPIPLRGS